MLGLGTDKKIPLGFAELANWKLTRVCGCLLPVLSSVKGSKRTWLSKREITEIKLNKLEYNPTLHDDRWTWVYDKAKKAKRKIMNKTIGFWTPTIS